MSRAQRLLTLCILLALEVERKRRLRRPPRRFGGGSVTAVTDHGKLTGLLDDDHTIYLLVNGTRAATSALKILAPANADALILGDATHEGGDISVYGDASGHRSIWIDADGPEFALYEKGKEGGDGAYATLRVDSSGGIIEIYEPNQAGFFDLHTTTSESSIWVNAPSGSGYIELQTTSSETDFKCIDPTGAKYVRLLDGDILLTGTVDGVDVSALKPHTISDATYHSGSITATQHGTQTSIPNAHHTPLIHDGLKVYLTNNQTITTSTWTRVNLDNEVYDDNTAFNTTTHLWTCPETARYLIVCGGMWTDMLDGTDCEIRFHRTTGGSPLYGVGRPGGAGYFSQREQTVASLTQNDVFEFQAYQASGGNRILGASEAYTFLSITKIGEA